MTLTAPNREADLSLYNKISLLAGITLLVLPSASFSNSILFWLAVSLICSNILFCKIKIPSTYISRYCKWQLVFLAVVLLSIVVSIDTNRTFDTIKSTAVRCIYLFVIYYIVDNKTKLRSLANIFVLAHTIMIIYVLTKIDISVLGNERIGAIQLGEGWNSNIIGLSAAYTLFFCLYLLSTRSKKSVFVTLYYLAVAVLMIVFSVESGSRKAILVCLIAPTIYHMLLSDKNKKFIYILVGLVVFYVFCEYVVYLPSVYDVLGHRLLDFFDMLRGETTTNYSLLKRSEMIQRGWVYFIKRPIWGYGFDNFYTLYGGETGYHTYSHNNFIELLVSGGIIAFIAYYWPFVSIIKSTLKKIKYNKNKLLVMPFTLVIILLFTDMAMVSYSEIFVQIIILIIFLALKLYDKE